MPSLTLEEWMEYGIRQGYCSPPICFTHDGAPTTAEEDAACEEGGDPCLFLVRLYADPEDKNLVEENFSPARWRKQDLRLKHEV